MNHYLLTGATGVVGSALLKLLMDESDQVTLLIRAGSEAHLQTRVKELIEFWDLDETVRQRIIALRSDLYTPMFGLTEDEYGSLISNVTHILHCAGNVNMSLPRDTARSQTLAMTHNVIELMEKGHSMKKMEYVSTVGVAGHTTGEIKEDWLSHKRVFRNSYEAAKAEAEEVIRQKIEQGLKITVHRPSMVVGNAQTGKNINFQVFYYLCEFLSGSRTFGWVPDLKNERLDLIPSDYVARVIYHSSNQEENPAKVLHTCSGPDGSIHLNILADYVRDIFLAHGQKLPKTRKIPVWTYKLLINLVKRFVPAKAKRALNTLPVFFNYLNTPQHFANNLTTEWGNNENIERPEVDTYLVPVLDYYLRGREVNRDR